MLSKSYARIYCQKNKAKERLATTDSSCRGLNFNPNPAKSLYTLFPLPLSYIQIRIKHSPTRALYRTNCLLLLEVDGMQRDWKIAWGSVLIGVMFLTLSLPYLVVSAELSAEWIVTFDDISDDELYSVEVVDDGYVLAGITNSSGFGQFDVWLIKTDSSGAMEWNRTYGGSLNDWAYSLVATSDGGYAFAGSTNSFGVDSADFWLVKVDSFGNLEWNQTYGGHDYDSCRSLVTTSDGGYVLLGYSAPYGSTRSPYDTGSADVWLVKVDSVGILEWNQTYGGSGSESVSTVIETTDGGYALACSTTSSGFGSADFWMIKVDSFGNIEWNQTYGESGTEYVNSLVATFDGGFALAGTTTSFGAVSADVWLVKVDSVGILEWNQTYGGPLADYCGSMITSSDDDYVLACITQPPTFGDGVFWLVETDSLGNLKGNQTYGVSAHHSHTSLVATADGSYILGGSTRDNMGNRDFWLAKIGETDTGSELLIYLSIPILVVVLMFIALLIYRRTKNSQNKS